jgi:hypothetical protein
MIIAFHEVRRNRVDVRGIRRERNVRARAARLVDQALEQEVRALRPFPLEYRFKCIEPFLGLERVGIVRCRKLWDGGHGFAVPVLLQGGRG